MGKDALLLLFFKFFFTFSKLWNVYSLSFLYVLTCRVVFGYLY